MLAFGNCSEPVEVDVVVPRLLVVVVVTLELLLVDPTGLLAGVDPIGVSVGVDPTGPSKGVDTIGMLVSIGPLLGVEPAGPSVGVGTIGLLPLGWPQFLVLVTPPGFPVRVVEEDVVVVDNPGGVIDGSRELTWRPSNS